MKHFKLALAATAASMAMAGAAHADTTWAFNVGGASDYVFRGIDQTYDFSGSGDSGFEVFGGKARPHRMTTGRAKADAVEFSQGFHVLSIPLGGGTNGFLRRRRRRPAPLLGHPS